MSEFPQFGGINPLVRIYTFRVYVHQGSTGMFVMVCELLFLLYLVFLTYRSVRRLYSMGWRRYFSNGWLVLDTLMIVGSIAAIAMYFLRSHLTDRMLRNFRSDPKSYVNFSVSKAQTMNYQISKVGLHSMSTSC